MRNSLKKNMVEEFMGKKKRKVTNYENIYIS